MNKHNNFLLILFFALSILVSCEKKNNPSAELITIQPPSSPDPDEIARVIYQDIRNRLKEARADMGINTPSLELVESRGGYYTYKGTVPFNSGASFFDREITVTYSGNSVVYIYTGDSSNSENTISWSKDVMNDTISWSKDTMDDAISRPKDNMDDAIDSFQNNVLRVLSPQEISPIMNDDISKRGLNSVDNLEYIPRESTDDIFVYEGYGYGNGGRAVHFTMYYDGKEIKYFFTNEPTLIYTIELEPDESRYIIPPKDATVISLQYPSYISTIPQYFFHFRLSNNEINFLRKVSEIDDLGNNLFIHYDIYQESKEILKMMSNVSQIDESDSILAYIYLGYSVSTKGGMIIALLDGFNVDVLPEQLYPISDKSSVKRLLEDIETSKAFCMLLIATTAEYINIASMENQSRSRRIQRLNNNLSSGNGSLFYKVFGSDAENMAVKGFTE